MPCSMHTRGHDGRVVTGGNGFRSSFGSESAGEGGQFVLRKGGWWATLDSNQ